MDLTPEQQAEAARLYEILRESCATDLKGLADLLAAKADRDLLGANELEVRDRVHRIGAKAIETALRGRNKGATTAPPGAAPAAGVRPSSSAGSPSGS